MFFLSRTPCNITKWKRILCIPISIRHAAQHSTAQHITSIYTPIHRRCHWIFFWMLQFFLSTSASSCVDLTVKLINNAFEAIFLPPALFWVRLLFSLSLCVSARAYILLFFSLLLLLASYRHYNLELLIYTNPWTSIWIDVFSLNVVLFILFINFDALEWIRFHSSGLEFSKCWPENKFTIHLIVFKGIVLNQNTV